MSDIVSGVSGLLSASWHFLMHTYIPATHIPFGVLFVGLCVMSLGFRFLSIILGFSVGIPETSSYAPSSPALPPHKPRISSARSRDVR